MAVFNQERFLKKAIRSILNQTFRDFKFLILDDGSTDGSFDIIQSFKDRRIKIFQNRKRQGLAKGLNFLIGKAKGKYIARMDGDDISMAARLKEQVEFLDKHPKVALIGCWTKIINDKGAIVGESRRPTEYQKIRKVILASDSFVHPSVMFRKNIFTKIGGYNEDYFYSQDYDLFLRFVIKYPCVNIPQYLLKFRWQSDFEKQKKQHLAALKIRLKAIKEYGYPKREIIKLTKPVFYYLIPFQIKKFYWQAKLKKKIIKSYELYK